MKLPDALRGIRQMAFDTPPLIYFVERHPDYFDRILFIMRYVNEGLIDGVSATIALTEVLVQPLKAGDNALAQQYEAQCCRTVAIFAWNQSRQRLRGEPLISAPVTT